MICTNPRDLLEAKQLNKYVDSYLVGLKDYIPNFLNPFSFADFLELTKLGKKVILRLDRLIRERELAIYSELIDKVKDLDIYYYVTDLGLFNLLIKANLINKTIYDPFTMITNYNDARVYYEIGVDAISPSQEIPYLDLTKFDTPLFYLGFGRRLMFNSKRKLLSLYKEKANLDFNYDNLYLIEEKREDKLPIFEDMDTYIYRSYYLSNLGLIDEIPNIKYLFLDSLTIPKDKYLTLVELTYNYLNNTFTKDELLLNIKELGLNIEDGFTYKDTIYTKGEIINEKN